MQLLHDFKNSDSKNINLDKKNLKIFRNIYHECLQKRKEKAFCLHLASMLHTIKGYYGPFFSKSLKNRVQMESNNFQNNKNSKPII